jgi:hypothetical protein
VNSGTIDTGRVLDPLESRGFAGAARRALPWLLVGWALQAAALVHAQPLFVYPFDSNSELLDWTVVSPAFSTMAWTNAEDVDSNPSSGAMEVINAGSVAFASAQFLRCYSLGVQPLATSMWVEASAASKFPSQGETGYSSLVVYARPLENCNGAHLSIASTSLASTGLPNQWVWGFVPQLELPPGTRSVDLRVFTNKTEASGSLLAYVDQVELTRIDLFSDGFESGDVLAWTASMP